MIGSGRIEWLMFSGCFNIVLQLMQESLVYFEDLKTHQMKKLIFPLVALFVGAAVVAFRPFSDIETLAIGESAPKSTMKMTGIDGKSYSLADVKGENGIAVVFTCNTCPFVVGADGYGEGWEARYKSLNGAALKTGFGVIYVNSNEAKREKGDDLASMKERAEKFNYADAPYVLDKGSELANAFGARTTPHVFLFDKNMKLVYRGAIDDSYESPAKVKEPFLFSAMGNMASGKQVDPADTKPVGCSIKRVS